MKQANVIYGAFVSTSSFIYLFPSCLWCAFQRAELETRQLTGLTGVMGKDKFVLRWKSG